MAHKRHYLGAVCLGLLQAVSLSAMFEDRVSAVFQILALSLYIRSVKNKSLNQNQHIKLISAWIFSTSWLLGSVWWLHIALHVHGHLPAFLSLTAIVLLCGSLALYYTVAIGIYLKYQSTLKAWQQAMLFAAVWTMAEMARAQWFTGFPWAAIGYAQINSGLSLAAPWLGVYGVGFIAAYVAGWLASIQIEKKAAREVKGIKIVVWHHKGRLTGVLLVFILLAIPVSRIHSNEKTNLSVALLQGNIPQDIKFNAGRQDALNWYKQASLASTADITVLPETALPYLKQHLPIGYWQDLEKKFNGEQQMAAIGMLTSTANKGYANSAVAIGLTKEPHIYNKYHLVPFGEFTPNMFRWFTKMLSLGLGEFEPGSDKPAPFTWQQHKFALNICYEDVFGEELAKRFVQGPENVPTVLVNISNIDWFGDTVVIPQHLNIARMRSLEFDRPSIRATNSGGTAIINAQGEITHQLKPFTRGVLQGEVASVDKAITPFAYWAGHWGLKPLWLLCLVILAWLIRQAKKNQIDEELLAEANVK